MSILAICLSSLEKYLCRSSARFFNWIVLFLLLSCVRYLSILDINGLSLIHHKRTSSLIFRRWSFGFVDGFLCCAKTFQFDVDPFVYSFFCVPCPRRCFRKEIASSNIRVYYQCFLLEMLWFRVLPLSLQFALSPWNAHFGRLTASSETGIFFPIYLGN